ncbi:MAG: DUF5110 domain-containing protein [Deltaproteobacteria bacterium]|jgi:alpha-glucosidase|nr:DUF5110 domain-containing protein [Deltaproteobacteria bacterium]
MNSTNLNAAAIAARPQTRPIGYYLSPLKLIVVFAIFFIFLLGFSGALKAQQILKFGPYFLTQERVGQGLWHFQISRNSPDPAQPWDPSPMLTPPAAWNNPPLNGNSARVWIDGADSLLPTLFIADTSDPSVPILEIKPYAPDGQLAGLAFFGAQMTHLVGLGADFRFTAVNINYLGHVVMPGGPFGNILESDVREQNSGIQAPVCYALGPGKLNAAVFVNETRPLMWDFSSSPWFVGPTGPLGPHESIDFFVILGPDLPSLRRSLMNILGRPPVPPRSVFSPWVLAPDKASYQSYDEYLLTIGALKDDFSYLTVLLDPSPAQPPLAAATASGLNYLVPETPYLPVDSPFFNDMEKKGFLVRSIGPQGPALRLNYRGRQSGIIDYTNPAAASYWHSLARSSYMLQGARLFYLTGGEPEVYSVTAWYAGASDPDVHSHYSWGQRFSLKWMEGFGIGQNNPIFGRFGPRLFLISRSGLAGLGRYGAGLIADEPNLFYPLGSGQARSHLTMSGVDYYSTDISSMLDQTPLDRAGALYESWLAKTALLNLPLVLPSSMLTQPWAQVNLALKDKFEPYYYSLAHQAYRTGDPIIAPLFFYFQEDVLARESAIETMVGPFLLVVSGARPGDELISFHLPVGRWYDYLGAEIIDHQESGQITMASKFQGIYVPPLLLRAGAIIPTIFDTSVPEKIFHILVFPSQEPTSFTLYEDNGTDKAYTNGDFMATKLEVSPATGSSPLKFTIRARETNESDTIQTSSRSYIVEFYGLDSVGVATLNGQLYDRVAKTEQLFEADSGWLSPGNGRLRFKTPPLELNRDHEIVIN